MPFRERIVVDPQILLGKPVVRGTRLAVDFLLSLKAQGWSEEEILLNHPGLELDDLLAAYEYASELVAGKPVITPGTGDWDAATEAVRDLQGYDFDAWREQRAYDQKHAYDHLL